MQRLIHAGLRRRQRGSAVAEYLIVVSFLVLVLVVDPTAIPELIKRFKEAYSGFVYALSISWI